MEQLMEQVNGKHQVASVEQVNHHQVDVK
jgi:hypothetical protein